MNLRVLLAGLASAFAAFFVGWIIYGMLLMGFFEANTQTYEGLVKDQMCFALIFAANLVYGILLAWIYKNFKGAKSLGKAIGISAVIGMAFSLGINLMFLASYNLINVKSTVADVLASGVLYGVMGLVIGLIIKDKKED